MEAEGFAAAFGKMLSHTVPDAEAHSLSGSESTGTSTDPEDHPWAAEEAFSSSGSETEGTLATPSCSSATTLTVNSKLPSGMSKSARNRASSLKKKLQSHEQPKATAKQQLRNTRDEIAKALSLVVRRCPLRCGEALSIADVSALRDGTKNMDNRSRWISVRAMLAGWKAPVSGPGGRARVSFFCNSKAICKVSDTVHWPWY